MEGILSTTRIKCKYQREASIMELRFILIGERFFHNFQSLEIIGDMYQCTEAFCHYS